MKTPYKLGAKRSKYDPRDHKFSAAPLAPVLWDRMFYDMVNKDFRINQGGEGTCVGHGATNVLLAGPVEHDLFPEFETVERAHQFARNVYVSASGDTTYQTGMYPRDACSWLKTNGFLVSYAGATTVDDVTTALLTTAPVMIALPWYWSMFQGNSNMGDKKLHTAYGNYWVKVNMDSGLAGFHCVALTGIDLSPDNGAPPYLRIQNSWGAEWGQNGTARLLVEDFRRLNMYDNWVFAEAVF
jgi:hypothetical protein